MYRYDDEYSRGVGHNQYGYSSYDNDDDGYLLHGHGRRGSAYDDYDDMRPPPVPPKHSGRMTKSQYSLDYHDYNRNNTANLHNPISSGLDHTFILTEPESTQRSSRWSWNRFKPDDWRKVPYFVYIVSIIQISVFIAELAKMGQLTGSPIQTKPNFNPMIGPSGYVLINMGARFTPCMHEIANITTDKRIMFPCPNSTSPDTDVCSLSELCGMGGVGDKPNQWWRFITPIFLHGGFIHIGFNMLLQLRLGGQLEKEIGLIRFVLVYMSSGIAGFVLGGNFTPDGITSSGASGSLFGVIALDLLDLLFNWQLYQRPMVNLFIHIIEIVVSFVLGLLPGLDNFSHIGGFAMGILVGTAILRSPLKVRLVGNRAEQSSAGSHKLQVAVFDWKAPTQHFKSRSPWWYVWCFVRIAAVVLAVVYFVTLIHQFENGGGHCKWCKYLSCLPVNGWCDQGKLETTTTST